MYVGDYPRYPFLRWQQCRQEVDSLLTAAGSYPRGMVGPFPGVPYSFGALRKTFSQLFVRCDVCRRYARLYLAEIRDADYRTKTFCCCRCGTGGALAITEPNTEIGMTDYRLDQVEGPQHHPAAVDRLTDSCTPAYRLSAKHYGVKTPTR